jgi:hypothetical protein
MPSAARDWKARHPGSRSSATPGHSASAPHSERRLRPRPEQQPRRLRNCRPRACTTRRAPTGPKSSTARPASRCRRAARPLLRRRGLRGRPKEPAATLAGAGIERGWRLAHSGCARRKPAAHRSLSRTRYPRCDSCVEILHVLRAGSAEAAWEPIQASLRSPRRSRARAGRRGALREIPRIYPGFPARSRSASESSRGPTSS